MPSIFSRVVTPSTANLKEAAAGSAQSSASSDYTSDNTASVDDVSTSHSSIQTSAGPTFTVTVQDESGDLTASPRAPSFDSDLRRVTSIASSTSGRSRGRSPSPSPSTSRGSLNPNDDSPASSLSKASRKLSNIFPGTLKKKLDNGGSENWVDDNPTPNANPAAGSPLATAGHALTPSSTFSSFGSAKAKSTRSRASSISIPPAPLQPPPLPPRQRNASIASPVSIQPPPLSASSSSTMTATEVATPFSAISAPPNHYDQSLPPTTGSIYIPTSASTSQLSRSSSRRSQTSTKEGKAWRRPSQSSSAPGTTRKRGSSANSNMGIAALASSSLNLSMGGTGPPVMPPPLTVSINSSTAVSSPSHSLRTPSSRRYRARSGSVSGSEDDEDDLSPDALSMELEDEDIPSITGFAVASMKRQQDFHDLFPEVGQDDYLIEDYGCALQREILIQGRLYISENHVSFHANIFGWITNFPIPFHSIVQLEKKMTAFVIPNAIGITTTNDTKYTFASFLSRDTTYDVMMNIWRLSRPGADSAGNSFREGSLLENDDSDTDGEQSNLSKSHGPEDHVQSPAGSTSNPNDILTPTPATSKTVGNVRSPTPGSMHHLHHPNSKRLHTPHKAHKATQCVCSKKGEHYSEVCMDATFPGTLESIYNLMFASGFVKDFMVSEQGLKDLQISDWKPEATGSHLLSRQMTYIKPLTVSVGPRQTKCELRDETIYVDFDDYVTMMTTTRTPDVPSGGVFAVKTRTCLTWGSPTSTRVLVTTMVEWSGRSFIRSIIDKSALDGQRTYHRDLERAMRNYISEHRGEFVAEGTAADTTPASPVEPITPPPEVLRAPSGVSTKDNANNRAKLDGMRGLQWVLDTATGTGQVARQSFWGAIDLIGDIIEDWNWTTVLALVVFFLIVSNVWTLLSLRQAATREELTRLRQAEYGRVSGLYGGFGPSGAAGSGEDDKVAAASVATEAVKVFLEEMVGASRQGQVLLPPHGEALSTREEVEIILKALDEIEKRVSRVKASVTELD
ncbi:hypothetical protein CALVIDRAFT_521820 [Calocera viscosa TUFC12733]|uniref:VASt domain-containing protein n=1 Tax=Calocera viscosa (strain TUFC12733) TaxID=1330018 RepID=A0A167H4G8_CALVF|nr:hypothetical protein CALVIDRAFT_521820 [Calocera viscosa TUFC12733]